MNPRCSQCRRPTAQPTAIGWQTVCAACFERVLWNGFARPRS